MDKKSKYLQLRLTKTEAAKLKEMAEGHSSVSQYILCAVKEFSNVNPVQRLDLLNRLGKKHKRCWDELSWANGNISQTVKRTKELVEAGKLHHTISKKPYSLKPTRQWTPLTKSRRNMRLCHVKP